MSCLIKCDKCGKTSFNVSGFMNIRAYRRASTHEYITETEKMMDVCKICYKKIFEGTEEEK